MLNFSCDKLDVYNVWQSTHIINYWGSKERGWV